MKNFFETFLARKGQIVTLTFKRQLKTRKSCGDKLEKLVTMQARAGVVYDNMATVQEKRESGELPSENQGLPWGQWEIFPHTITHNGKRYLRFSSLFGGNPSTVKFFRNGANVSREDVLSDCLASEFSPKTELDVFNVKEENIISIA